MSLRRYQEQARQRRFGGSIEEPPGKSGTDRSATASSMRRPGLMVELKDEGVETGVAVAAQDREPSQKAGGMAGCGRRGRRGTHGSLTDGWASQGHSRAHEYSRRRHATGTLAGMSKAARRRNAQHPLLLIPWRTSPQRTDFEHHHRLHAWRAFRGRARSSSGELRP